MQWFLLHLATLTPLREFRLPGGHLDHLRASTRSQTRQASHKPPWGMTLDTAPKTALPRVVRDFFQHNDLAVTQEAMHEASMQTRAMGGETPLPIGQVCLNLALPDRFPPVLAPLPAGFDLSVGEVVVGVIGAALSIQVPLLAPHRPVILRQFRAEWGQRGLSRGDHGNRGRAKVQPNDALAQRIRALLIRLAFADQLGTEAVSPPNLAPHQPHIFDASRQSMGQHRVFLLQSLALPQLGQVSQQGHSFPHHPVTPPGEPGLVALALYRIELLFPLESDVLGFPDGNAQHRVERPAGQFLAHGGIQVILDPVGIVTTVLRIRLQSSVGEGVGSPCRSEGSAGVLELFLGRRRAC